jgi:hypothetical protein
MLAELLEILVIVVRNLYQVFDWIPVNATIGVWMRGVSFATLPLQYVLIEYVPDALSS